MARGQVKSIIGALNSKPSFEHEFAVEKSIADIKKISNVSELQEIATTLARANAKQSHFIAQALEIMCEQQERLFIKRKKANKKAPLMKRLKYILFGEN